MPVPLEPALNAARARGLKVLQGGGKSAALRRSSGLTGPGRARAVLQVVDPATGEVARTVTAAEVLKRRASHQVGGEAMASRPPAGSDAERLAAWVREHFNDPDPELTADLAKQRAHVPSVLPFNAEEIPPRFRSVTESQLRARYRDHYGHEPPRGMQPGDLSEVNWEELFPEL